MDTLVYALQVAAIVLVAWVGLNAAVVGTLLIAAQVRDWRRRAQCRRSQALFDLPSYDERRRVL